MTTTEERKSREKAEKSVIVAADISGASIATLMLNLGFTLGKSTWGGRICIWGSPWLVLILPPMLVILIQIWDSKLRKMQYRSERKELLKMAKEAKTEKARKEFLARAHQLDLERADYIARKIRGYTSESEA
ncbi:hypothetical protein GCM10009548_36020 [Streptomyces malaysiensis subsp. malaysiensis]|uniref:Uncharacterized protein n=1 Tax=Streptomyces malaysiensis TaxID=92644 RepID=A0ABX6WCL0_STRMQ|nr:MULTISPECIES: hypothetical protein [Streptomyces]QPI58838.1 hypothetical protein I1A49_31595 [Streptomyces solisilvae]UHH20467.1 hypothetical protein LUV23_31795 [Streptomyces sp. HNM0561]